MRRLALLLLVCACNGEIDPLGGADAGTAADARAGVDARAGADARVTQPDAMTFPPSPANVGWIGGACAGPADCPYTDGVCLTEGFPNGLCTRECGSGGTCPDRGQPNDTVTGCIDGRAFGFDQGACVSRCDPAVLPPTGCPAGYACLPKSKYLEPTTVEMVCVPAVPRGDCNGDDEFIPINYPERGGLWIPGEAQCGGDFPLVVLLHGINPNKNPTPSLNGGRHLDYEVRSLIDARLMKPVLLAEPVQTDSDAASSTGLYSPAHWEPAHHLDLLAPALAQRGITISSLSYTGHSGAGCDSRNGLYLVLARYADLIPAKAPALKMWGAMDICYGGTYNWKAPSTALATTGTAIINIFSIQGDPSSFEAGLIADPAPAECPDAILRHCIKHKTKPWCSYRTVSPPIQHEDNPGIFVREEFPKVFPVDPAIVPCP